MDAVGRKLSLIIAQSASLVGWIIVTASFDVVTVCVGRFIGGAASAATTLVGKKFGAISGALIKVYRIMYIRFFQSSFSYR